jgi:hypothetical protein
MDTNMYCDRFTSGYDRAELADHASSQYLGNLDQRSQRAEEKSTYLGM